MKNILLSLATAAAVVVGSLALPSTAEARPRGRYWGPAYGGYYRPYYGYRGYYAHPSYRWGYYPRYRGYWYAYPYYGGYWYGYPAYGAYRGGVYFY